MKVAILINLDYANAPYEDCKFIWSEIQEKKIIWNLVSGTFTSI